MKTKNIFLTFALAMFTTFAFAQFTSTLMSATTTAHNFVNGTGVGTGIGELVGYTFAAAKGSCAACHQPHNAGIQLPLWGHASAGAGAYTAYVSGVGTTINGSTDLANGNSKLCLGCHDGSANLDNFGGKAWNAATTLGVWKPGDAAYASFGTDLSNDHPVSITYPSDATAVAQQMNLGSTLTGVKLFGALNRVECASCHSIHNPASTNISKLLVVNNAGSALCLKCHAK